MKRRWTITLLAIPVAVLVAMLLTYRHHTVPLEQCSDLYRRYAADEHLNVAFLQGFRINDTLRLDVTTLQARDSAGWILLKEDFNIPELPELFRRKIERGEDKVSVRRAPRNAPNMPIDTTNYNNNVVVAISRLHQTVSIFHTKTESEQDAVSNNQLKL